MYILFVGKLDLLFTFISMAGADPPLQQQQQHLQQQQQQLRSEYKKTLMKLIKDFVGERLRRKGIRCPGYEREDLINENTSISEIALTLRRVGNELELADAQFVANMCNRLSLTSNTAYSMFQGISDKIFASGKNWGRVVAFLTFGSSLAVHCAERQDMGQSYVDRVVEWIYTYMTTTLEPWISDQGGWVSKLPFFTFNSFQVYIGIQKFHVHFENFRPRSAHAW